MPVFYDVLVPDKKQVEENSIVLKNQSKGFGTKVGFLTNTGSTMTTMLSDFDEASEEFQILNDRYKSIRFFQGVEIDKQKGLIVPEFPKWWSKLEKDATDLEKKITVTKRPYFFKYLYGHMQTKYNQERDAYENICQTIYKMSLEELNNLPVKTKDQQALLDQYKKDSSFIDNNSIMNRVSHYMENKIREISKSRQVFSKKFDYRRILSNKDYTPSKTDLEKGKLLYKEYKSLKRALRENTFDYGEVNYSTLDQIKKYINDKGYSAISSNSEELGNLAVYLCYNVLGETSRKFAWDCFGEEIFLNIQKRKREKFVRVPVKNEKGSFTYLFDRYGFYLVNIKNEQ